MCSVNRLVSPSRLDKHPGCQNMYCVDMAIRLTFDEHAAGRPYHAARVLFSSRSGSRPHWHSDFAEIFLVTQGRGIHLLDGDDRDLDPGDLVFVRDRDRHGYRVTHGLEFINIAFPSEAWAAFCGLMGSEAPAWWELEAEPVSYHLGPMNHHPLIAIFERALAQFYGEPSVLDLIDFWSKLLRFLAQAQQGGAHTASTPDWLAEACSLMHQEDNLRSGLPRLVELSGVSDSHLSRCMRTYFATTPTDFVNSLRLQLASVLLASTTVTVTQVAHRCGFSSQSYFSRCFTRARGMSPREYRRRAQRSLTP